MTSQQDSFLDIDDEVTVEVENVAHGGHMVARHAGQVIFVRHAIPGEKVRVRITERSKSFLRADTIEVLTSAEIRVDAPCRHAGVCGGCDFQHISEQGQLRLLGRVLSEQLRRIAHEEWTVQVETIGGFLGWRTRMDWAIDVAGVPGLRRHRSHDLVNRPQCLIAHRDLPDTGGTWSGSHLRTVATSSGQQFLVAEGPLPDRDFGQIDGVVDSAGNPMWGEGTAIEMVHGRSFEVSPTGFWQVHPRAAETLVTAVLQYAEPRAGETVIDLYSGVGLFSRFLAEAVGESGRVHAVEGSKKAQHFATRNLESIPWATAHQGSVEKVLQGRKLPSRADVVVADPPRRGAKEAIRFIALREARRIVHIACDPASLARDVNLYREHGYQLKKLRAFALFPMTHHIECVALFEPTKSGRS